MTFRQAERLRRGLFHLALAFSVVVFVCPFYWMLKTSVEPSADIFTPPMTILPKRYSLEHYRQLLWQTDFLTNLRNSLIVALGAVVVTVACAVPGGYALARFALRGKKTLARFALLSYMFPPLMLGVPFYLLFNFLHLRDTFLGLIIAHATIVLPFGLWLMWQFFQTVPFSYEESAWVAGASRFRTFLEVAVPLASPGIITIAVLTFALSWSDFEFAFILTTSQTMETLPVGIYRFVTGFVNWGLTQAAAVVITVPALLVVFLLQGYLIRGLGSGGLK